MKIENEVVSVNQFKCKGRREDGGFVFFVESTQMEVIVKTYRNGASEPMCHCLTTINTGKCNYYPNDEKDSSELHNCPYYKK